MCGEIVISSGISISISIQDIVQSALEIGIGKGGLRCTTYASFNVYSRKRVQLRDNYWGRWTTRFSKNVPPLLCQGVRVQGVQQSKACIHCIYTYIYDWRKKKREVLICRLQVVGRVQGIPTNTIFPLTWVNDPLNCQYYPFQIFCAAS